MNAMQDSFFTVNYCVCPLETVKFAFNNFIESYCFDSFNLKMESPTKSEKFEFPSHRSGY